MTRFARAKGSKSSNERVPESATSWRDMKNDLLKKSEENTVQESESSPSEKKFYKLEKQEKTVKWSEFPFDDEQIKKQKLKGKKENLQNKQQAVKNSEDPVEGKKKKKRKLQADDPECPVKTAKVQNNNSEELEASSADPNKPSKKKSSKKKRTAVCSESKESNDDKFSSSKDKQTSNINNNSIRDTDRKQSKKIKQVQNQGKGNFSNNNNNNRTGGKKMQNKKNDSGEHKRRKPINEVNTIYINGNEIEISYYDGYPIKKADAERLKELKKEMISRGLPRSEIMSSLKLERRKAEKSLAREKKKVCFNCRKSGHILSECPMLQGGSDAQLSETGICFKCGSTEHTHFQCRVTRGDNFKFAQCFICKEQGHIARQCPDNNKGLYPKGGACKICGDVTHLKKDCPKYQSEQEENKIVADTIDDHNIESLEIEAKQPSKKQKKSQKIVQF